MGILTFPHAGLVTMLAAAEEGWKLGIRDYYGQKTGPGFWFVGDHGVYLMPNAVLAKGEKPVVVYACECDPTRMEFDDWYDAKRDLFGGDDGAEIIEPMFVQAAVRQGDNLVFRMSRDSYEIEFHPAGDSRA